MASELARSSVPGLSDEEVHQLLSVFKQEGKAPPIEKLRLLNPTKNKYILFDASRHPDLEEGRPQHLPLHGGGIRRHGRLRHRNQVREHRRFVFCGLF